MPGDVPVPAARFVGPSGEDVACVSRSEMREIDRLAVEDSGPSLLQMMENAGRSMAQLILDQSAASSTSRVLVLAGTGGNGGGGIAAARHLAPRIGHVDVCLVKPHRLSESATTQLSTYRGTEGHEISLHSLDACAPYDVIVDAVIGYGLLGAPHGPEQHAIEWAASSSARVFALDVPSGLDSDSGTAPGAHIRADVTLTLHLPKPGLTSEIAGELYLADLGIPAAVTQFLGIAAPSYGPAFVIQIERALISRQV